MFFKKRVFLPVMAMGLGIVLIMYGVFIHPLLMEDDAVLYYNSGVRHLRTYLESGGEEALSSAKESFQNALVNSPSPPVAAATLYNGTIPALFGTDWEELKSRSILEGVITELQGAGRYDPRDQDIKINLTKALALKESLDKFFRKGGGDALVPLPPNLQSSREEEEKDVSKPKPDDTQGKESGSKTPPPDF